MLNIHNDDNSGNNYDVGLMNRITEQCWYNSWITTKIRKMFNKKVVRFVWSSKLQLNADLILLTQRIQSIRVCIQWLKIYSNFALNTLGDNSTDWKLRSFSLIFAAFQYKLVQQMLQHVLNHPFFSEVIFDNQRILSRK